jgi:xylulokinase
VADDRLAVLGEARAAYGLAHPRPGWAEQDPAAWEAALGPAVAGALRAAGLGPRRVRALGLTGQLDGCVPVDGDARPLGPCLVWMDRRAAREAARAPEDVVRAVSGLTPDAGHMAAKIRWLLDHVPAARRAARFHQPVSYLVARLTGRHVYDHGLASTTMLYDLARRAHDPALLDAFGVAPERLPEIAPAAAPAGPLHAAGAALAGLPPGLPVAVGTGDDFATPLGAGIVAPGPVACVLGTAEVVGALDPAARRDDAGLVETHAYVDGQYFIENPGWLGGGAVAWLAGILGLDGAAEVDRRAAEVPPGADGVVFLPALTGAMAPAWAPGARGAFYGLTPAHGAGHLARAVLEGCAFAMRDVVERLRALEVAADRLILLGGGARSPLWARIHADAAGLPAEVPARTDTAPVGAAMLAAVAGGVQPDLAACARLTGGAPARVEPDPAAAAALEAAHAAYRRLFASLRPLFEAPPGPAPDAGAGGPGAEGRP